MGTSRGVDAMSRERDDAREASKQELRPLPDKGVLFLEGDGDELAWPLADFLIEFPSESFEAGAAGKVREALNGGNGMSWVDKACARRCGIDADAKKAPAEAAAEDKKKKP